METIIKETIESYNNYLQKIPNGCQQIANILREDESKKEGLSSILNFSEGITWIIDANLLLAKNGYVNEISINKINDYLEEINNSLGIGDYFSVADLFEYEIKPFFENCKPYEIKHEN